ncbi:MAG: MBL fold metallo-hydrolase [Pseudomonadales bacterium]
MKISIWYGLFAMLLSNHLAALSITEERVNKAAEIVQQAVEAHGGKEALSKLNALVIEHRTEGFSVQQSRKPEAPWDKYFSQGTSAIEPASEVFTSFTSGASGGFEFDSGTIINSDASYQVDYRAGTATPIAEPDFSGNSGPFVRVTPALLLTQLMQRAHTAMYLGEVKHNRAKHSVVSFTMEVGPAISLYFNKKTHMLTHSERVLPGVGLVEYEFLDYERISGIAFNKKFQLRVNGDLDQTRTNISTKINQPLVDLTTVDQRLLITDAIGPDELRHEEIAEGVHLIGGSGTYGLFVEMRDFVVAVGGTGGNESRIEKLREIVTDKPIRYGVFTHHHSDHVVAVNSYIENQAVVVVAEEHEKVIRAAAGKADINLETVKSKKIISDGSQKVVLLDIGPTAHTEHLLVAWLPEHSILFEADHFGMPRSGPVRPAVESTRSFAKALKKHKLQPDIFASAHSPVTASMKDLKDALKKKPFKR